MKRKPHTTFYRGKRIFISLDGGEKIIDKFVSSNDRFLFTDNHKIPINRIRAASNYKKNDE